MGLSLGHTDVFPASPQSHLLVDKSRGLVCLLLLGEALVAPFAREIAMMVLYEEQDVKRILLRSLETHRCQRGQILPTESTQQDL